MSRVYCGEINNTLIDKEVLINGWIKKNKKLGKLIFLTVSDRSGYIQVIVDEKNEYFELAKSLKRESVVEIIGVVCIKQDLDDSNSNQYEIRLNKLKVYSISEITPLIIEEETDALEDVRMNYRFLDLRRPNMQRNIIFRSHVLQAIRTFLSDNGFIEIETPILGKPTPEGARDYLVPSRIFPNKFYALPQSPQIYKQLLMVSGFDRYFQIARCFRDEDLRSDRQPEFTQLDMELSFINQYEIINIVENLIKYVFKKTLNVEIKTPFVHIDYNDAMNIYGCDKPDLRFDLKLNDCSNFFKNSEFLPFNNLDNNEVIKSIVCDKILTKKDIVFLEKFAKDNGAKSLFWCTFNSQTNEITGSLTNKLENELIIKYLKLHNLESGTIIFVVDKLDICNKSLGAVRNNLADLLNLKHKNSYKFVWIVNWPLFEYSDEKQAFLPAHHPFTQPQDQYHDTFDIDKANALAKAYDIVLNGYELGGGSIRITDPNMQKKMFSSIGLKTEEIDAKFGYLLNAFKYGVPPHGGIAIGIDRLITLMLNLINIKDVIAFPKNASAFDQMLKAPSDVNEFDLEELGLKFI